MSDWDRATSLLWLPKRVDRFIDQYFLGTSGFHHLVNGLVPAWEHVLLVVIATGVHWVIGWGNTNADKVVRASFLHALSFPGAKGAILEERIAIGWLIQSNRLLSHGVQALRLRNLEVRLTSHAHRWFVLSHLCEWFAFLGYLEGGLLLFTSNSSGDCSCRGAVIESPLTAVLWRLKQSYTIYGFYGLF